MSRKLQVCIAGLVRRLVFSEEYNASFLVSFLRSALRRTSPSRRLVQLCEDEHGRAVDLTVVRPSTPAQNSRNLPRVEFASQTTCHPRSRPTSAWLGNLPASQQVRGGDVTGSSRCEHVTNASGYIDEEARQALLAIYQAGKPDMMFQTRAPSSTALEKMLLATSDARGRDASSVAGTTRKYDSLRNHPQHRDAETGHRYTTDREVSDEDKPVKVNVECPPRSDTVFSFRVHSKAS